VLFSLQVNAVLGILCAITIYLGLLLALQAVSMSELAELPRLGKAVFERKLGR
jgi:hypothetical protein